MPLQNRVTPWGEIVAFPERGTMMGNRGGRFHRPDRTLGRRRWASHHWICCEISYRGMHHEPMGKGYTSLFFLDEVTALAAGHRPCFFCRRADAKRFFGLLEPPMSLDAFDRRLHGERRAGGHAPPGDLPDGAMVELEGKAFAVLGPVLLQWTPGGYSVARARATATPQRLLTPPLIIAILARGYRPRWHGSAAQIRGNSR
jgi:hypothetical protein